MPEFVLTLDGATTLEARLRRQIKAEMEGVAFFPSTDADGAPIQVARSVVRPRMADQASASATSDPLTIGVACDARLSLLATEPAWPAVDALTLELVDPATQTVVTSHTVGAATPLPWSVDVALGGRVARSLVIHVHAHGDALSGQPLRVTLQVEALPWT